MKRIYLIILLTAAAAILIYCFSEGISGNDFWWHVKAGEWICANRTVPNRDIFSWYGREHNLKWVAHEWLAEVIFWQIFRIWGERGIFVFSLSSAMLMTILLTARIQKYAMDNCLITALYICFFCVAGSLFFYGRPQVFAFFLLYGELYCLYEFMEGRKIWCLYLIPGIACLWSNLHGGSVNLSYLLVALVLVGGVRSWRVGRIYGKKWTKIQMCQLLAVLFLSVGAVFLNPAGPEVFLFPYVNMADPVAMNLISEWASPDAKKVGEILNFFLPVFLLCFGMLFGRKEIKSQDALICFLFLALFFRSVRFLLWFEIAAAFWAFPYVLPCRLKVTGSLLEKGVVVCLELALLAGCCKGIWECRSIWEREKLVGKVLEERVLEVVQRDAPSRIYNDYNYGGALIYAGLPVFIDERADIYTQDNLLAEAVSLLLMQQVNISGNVTVFEPEEMIRRYEFDAFLVGVNRPVYSYLHSHEEWYEEVLTTENTAYFKRR